MNMHINVSNIIIALEQGLRHSDLPLVRSCIDRLWVNDQESFIQQAPLIILRNAWYFIREYAELLQEQRSKSTYLKIFGRLAVIPTNRDALALPMLINGHRATIPAKLIKPYSEAKNLLQHPAGFRGATEWWISERLIKKTKYEQSAGLVIQDTIRDLVTDLVERPENSQEIIRDIKICMAALYLIESLGLSKTKIQNMIIAAAKKYAKEYPRTGTKSIPYFAFSPESDIGKAAIKNIRADAKQKKQFDGIDLAELWRIRMFESSNIDRNEIWWSLLKFKHKKQWDVVSGALQDEVFKYEVLS